MNLKLGASALSACLLMGCATVTRGQHETFVVESTPPNARVQLSTGLTCDATPCSFRIERKGSFAATVSKDGYKTTTYNVSTQVAGAGAAGVAGNVLVGGLIGLGVDAATGAALEHKPNPLQVTLEAEPVVVAEATAPAAQPLAAPLAGAPAAPASPAPASTAPTSPAAEPTSATPTTTSPSASLTSSKSVQ